MQQINYLVDVDGHLTEAEPTPWMFETTMTKLLKAVVVVLN